MMMMMIIIIKNNNCLYWDFENFNIYISENPIS